MHEFCAYRKPAPTPQRVVENQGSSIEMSVWLNDQRGVVMKIFKAVLVGSLIAFSGLAAAQNCPYDPRCIINPHGAGSLYGPIINPYASNSATNPYAIEAPRLYDSQGNYRWSAEYQSVRSGLNVESVWRYGNPHSPDSLNNPYGAANPDDPRLIYVVPVK